MRVAPDGAPVAQSDRGPSYEEAFEKLKAAGRLYPCFCSRRDIAAAASAPQAPGDETPYGGACRNLDADAVAERLASGRLPAWRFRVDPDELAPFDDLVRGRITPDLASAGDFVVRRADGVPAYQLAVVVDDAAQAITDVVRGADLLASTPRQIFLQRLLGVASPRYLHVPVAVDAHGRKLSKETGAAALPASALSALLTAWRFLEQPVPDGMLQSVVEFWSWAQANWRPAQLPRVAMRPAPRRV